MQLLDAYIRLDLAKLPAVCDLVQMTAVGRVTAEHFIACMRCLEAKAYEDWAATQRLSGNVEVDGTFLTKFHIKHTNKHYADMIFTLQEKLRKARKKRPSSYTVHVMCLGAQPRGCPALVYVPRPVVCMPGSRPITETRAQIEASKLLDKVDKRKNRTIIFADGNKSWKFACADRGLRHEAVTHQTKTFVKPVKKASNKALSTLAGTQSLDRSWLSLKTWLGTSPKAKGRIENHTCLRPELTQQVSQWAWRKSLPRPLTASVLQAALQQLKRV